MATATQLQLRSGTKIQNNLFTGAAGEMTYETDTGGLRIHNGQKQGGNIVPVIVDMQLPTAENGYVGYKKYSNGLVEMGGVFDIGADATSNGEYTIPLPVEMADANYAPIAIPAGNTAGSGFGAYISIVNNQRTTTNFKVYVFKTETSYRYINWRVEGLAATE